MASASTCTGRVGGGRQLLYLAELRIKKTIDQTRGVMKNNRMPIRITLAVLAAFSLGAFAADPLPRAKPESVGMSSARLDKIGEVLKSEVDKGMLQGAVVAIARKGKLVY